MSATNEVFKGITVEFKGETTDLDKAISEIRKEFKGLKTELKDVDAKLKTDPFNSDLLRQKLSLLNKAIENSKEQVDKWKGGIEALREKQKELIAQQNQLTETAGGKLKLDEKQLAVYNDLELQIEQCTNAINSAEKSLRASEKQLTSYENKLYKFKQQHYSDVFKDLAKQAEKVEQVFNGLAKVTAPISMGSAAALTASAKAASDFETNLVAVQKVLKEQGSGTRNTKGLSEIEQEIKDMATVVPTSLDEIAQAYANAAQLGVQNDDLQNFVETMLRLGSATDIDSSEAATTLAQFYNIIGGDIENVDELANAIVRLGNNLPTTESAILNMSREIGASAAQVDFTESQIVALAAALTSMGLESSAAGSATSTMITSIDKAIDLGEAQAFADIIGVTSDELKELWKTDAAGTFVQFVGAMKNASDNGESLNLMLEEVGFTSIRQDKTIKALVNNYDGLASAMELAEDAYKNGSDAIQESDTAWSTFASNVQLLVNNLKILGVELGNEILPIIQPVVEKIKDLVHNFASMDEGTKQTIVKLLGLTAVVSPLLSVFGKLAGGVKNFFKIISNLVKGEKAFNLLLKLKDMFDGGFISGIKSLFTLLGGWKTLGIVAAIALLVAGLKQAWETSDSFRTAVQNIWETITNFWQSTLVPLANNIVSLIQPILESVGNIIGDLIQIASNLWTVAANILSWLVQNLFPVLQQIWNNILLPLANGLSTILLGTLGLVVDAIESVVNWAQEGIDKLMELLGLKEGLKTGDFTWHATNPDITGVSSATTKTIGRGGGSFAINSAGLGLASAGIGNMSLATTITVNNNGEPIESNTVRRWADQMTDIISENLGKRLCNV